MSNYKETNLWKESFEKHEHPKCKVLITAFDSFRNRVKTLSNEIIIDQPSFSVHDITHIDALWDMASYITGEEFKMTPIEGFVLGGAFLVHDLAMSQAAYPSGISEIKSLPQWKDTIYTLLKKEEGCEQIDMENCNISAEIEQEAIRILLRELHAAKARELCTVKWEVNGTEYYLIDNPELRESFGNTIGEIAASHWWSLEDVKIKLNNRLGSPSNFPSTWTVNKLKLAAILRLADYCQIDERRAPSFLMAIRKPEGISRNHWEFQNKLVQPIIEGHQLKYTAKRPFKKKESIAWWLCYDTLKAIDLEIRETNTMLKEAHVDFNFWVQGISNIESPERLSECIQTDSWLPIDTNIHVTNVVNLAKRLGGKRLYGDNNTVPIREVLQNASDAVRARRIFEDKESGWGEILTRTGKDSDGFWIEIEDNGIGMSDAVIRGPLLDFGKTFWGSNLMLREFPGLISKGYFATGRFGVGFFSIFMISKKIKVTTLRLGNAKSQTRVLEFDAGLLSRPLLRQAKASERIDSGTKIKMWLNSDVVNKDGGIITEKNERPMEFDRLCEWLCPSSDVNISFDNGKKTKRLIKANDWQSISGLKLLKRISRDKDRYGKYPSSVNLKHELTNLRLLKENGRIVGRACILHERPRNRKIPEDGVITIGGLRANYIRSYRDFSFFGIIIGKPNSASRNSGFPILNNSTLAAWASKQAVIHKIKSSKDSFRGDYFSSFISELGGDPISHKIGYWADGDLSINSLKQWDTIPDKILIVEEGYAIREIRKDIKLASNSIVIPRGSNSNFIETNDFGARLKWPKFPTVKLEADNEISENSVYFLVLRTLSEKWNSTLDEVIKASDFSIKKRVVGKKKKKSVKMESVLIVKPQK